MLVHDLHRPPSAHDGATVAVLLHGRGSHRGDLQALRAYLPRDWVLVTPQGPHPGHPWGYGPGWAWYRYAGDDRVEEEGLASSLSALDGFLQGLPALLGLDPGRVLLGGFSQGGTTALAYALTRPARVDAALVFSGFLADVPPVVEALDPAPPTPVFWGHGRRDPAIPHALAARGRGRLQRAEARLTARDYDIGHWIEPAEIADAVAFAEEIQRSGSSPA